MLFLKVEIFGFVVLSNFEVCIILLCYLFGLKFLGLKLLFWIIIFLIIVFFDFVIMLFLVVGVVLNWFRNLLVKGVFLKIGYFGIVVNLLVRG